MNASPPPKCFVTAPQMPQSRLVLEGALVVYRRWRNYLPHAEAAAQALSFVARAEQSHRDESRPVDLSALAERMAAELAAEGALDGEVTARQALAAAGFAPADIARLWEPALFEARLDRVREVMEGRADRDKAAAATRP